MRETDHIGVLIKFKFSVKQIHISYFGCLLIQVFYKRHLERHDIYIFFSFFFNDTATFIKYFT